MAISHTILGAISAAGVVNTSIRKPNTKKSKKRKLGTTTTKESTGTKKRPTTGTTTSHYVKFLIETMDFMDRFPEFKNCYHTWLWTTQQYIHQKTSTS